jgi:hypothetical protein
MFRSGGKHRIKRFREPLARKVTSQYENYGIITGYHGGAGRYCTVQVYTPEDNKIEELKQVRMKGGITHPKCKQRIAVGSCVLLQYGEIALIYKDNSLVPPEILELLENAVGEVNATARGGPVKARHEEDASSSEVSDEDEEEEEKPVEQKDNDLI